jgi:membrane protein DedA with SNARE-associated domain
VLAYIGYFVGDNKERIAEISRQWGIYIIIGCALLLVVYILWHKRKQKTFV